MAGSGWMDSLWHARVDVGVGSGGSEKKKKKKKINRSQKVEEKRSVMALNFALGSSARPQVKTSY